MTADRTILLVEDNQDDAELTKRAFAKNHLAGRLVIVSDGAEALDYLFGTGVHAQRAGTAAPAIVLLDLNLPKIDGLDVLKKIRADARTRRLPVVVLTSSKEEHDVTRSYDLGANSFVRKPVDFNQFVEMARRIGGYWLELNELPPLPRGGDE